MATAPAPINLDALAGIPMTPGVLAAWQSAAEQGFSDPARLHHVGRHAGLLLDSARASIAQSLGVRSDQIFFASSAPDGLRVAITGIFRTRAAVSRRIIAGAVESMAVLNTVSGLVEHSGASVTSIPVNSWGELDLDTALSALGEPAALACLQVANAEVGTRQPFSQLLATARSHGVPVVADASGVISHDPLPADFDVLVAPARDWGGPPGVAVVITHPHIRWRPEEAPDRGWIGGFPDIPAAVAAAVVSATIVPASAVEAITVIASGSGVESAVRDPGASDTLQAAVTQQAASQGSTIVTAPVPGRWSTDSWGSMTWGN